jgi:hypothetical protein
MASKIKKHIRSFSMAARLLTPRVRGPQAIEDSL